MSEQLYDYVLNAATREHPVLRALARGNPRHRRRRDADLPDQGQFMALLAQLIGAKRAVEVGTFTGYSALAVALALPADGRLICCDINAETTAVARRFWTEAGVAAKIDLRIAPALQTLDALLAAGESGALRYDVRRCRQDRL